MLNLYEKFFFTLVGINLKFLLTKADIFGESKTTTLSLINDFGYPGEEHNVTTKDKYILTLYQIPYSSNYSVAKDGKIKRPVVFIMHGYGTSSSDYVLGGYPMGLAFLLSEAGYDVWLGNARGTRYSKAHEYLELTDPAYWDFSWHEIGIYDIPASVDYILEKTKSSTLQYIGHSQGASTFLVATSSISNFNDKIKSAHLFGPVVFFNHSTSVLLPLGALVLGQPRPLPFGATELLPNSRMNEIASEILCDDDSVLQFACTGVTFLIFGTNSKFTNDTAVQLYFETSPAGTSIKQLFHILQIYNSKKFRQFDYDTMYNERIYGQETPPEYKLENITAPIYIYYSENDALADPQDIDLLINTLPSTTVKKAYKIPYESWNHLDFLFGNHVDEIVYSVVLEDMNNAEERN